MTRSTSRSLIVPALAAAWLFTLTAGADAAALDAEASKEAVRTWWYRCDPVPDQERVEEVIRAALENPDHADVVFLASRAVRAGLAGETAAALDAKDALVRAAQLGDSAAKATLAMEKLTAKDGEPQEADRESLLKLVEAKNPDATFYCGALLAGGEGGFERDPAKARELLTRAIEMGVVRAHAHLSHLKLDAFGGEGAAEEMLKGAEAGDPQAQLQMAEWYLLGSVVLSDPKEGFRWMRLAADRPDARATAIRRLGDLYAKGIGTPRDDLAAFVRYKRAAMMQDTEAARRVAWACFSGAGTEVNPDAGLKILRQLADGGVADASYDLGVIYLEGLYVTRDLQGARNNFAAAAARGDAATRERATQYVKDIERLISQGEKRN